MHIAGLVDDANYQNVHSVTVNVHAGRVWSAAERAASDFSMGGVAAIPLAAAALMRGESPRLRRGRRGLRFEVGDRVGTGGSGFEVAHVRPGREVVLTGRHRYAEFATNLYLEPLDGDHTRLWNVTRARFRTAGIGRVYRLGVGVFHDLYVEGALRRIKRLAERD